LEKNQEKNIHKKIPTTQGIKYAGSKLKILPSIFEILSDLELNTVLDGFSGSTRVSQAFAKAGFQTISNDISVWSEVFAKAFLLNKDKSSYYRPMIEHLNQLKGKDGWFSKYYGGTENSTEKRPFQLKNARRLDAIREEIDKMNLSEIEKCVALTSLIFALDAVDNTMGHYVSYLAKWSPRSYNDLQLKVPQLFENTQKNEVFRGDVFEVIKDRRFDLAYFDPPYGSNNEKMPPSRVRYNSYYHIWKTVILNDQPPLFGKVNRREDSRDEVEPSVFEEFRKDEHECFIAMNAIRRLIQETDAHYILLSYSSGGRATKEELFSILEAEGKIRKAIEIDYKKNVMSAMSWTNEWINSDGKYCEYLFLLEKDV